MWLGQEEIGKQRGARRKPHLRIRFDKSIARLLTSSNNNAPAGSLWAMGYNGNGQLGDGSTTNRNPPVKSADLILVVEQPYAPETAADVTDN